MKPRLKIYFSLLLFWMCFFWLSKLLFLFFNFDEAFKQTGSDWINIFAYGLRIDFASAGYLMLFTGLLIAFLSYANLKFLYHILNIYIILILLINILLLIGDLELYKHWKFRMDSTPLRFLGNPGEAFASVTWATILRQIILGITLFSLSYFIFRKLIVVQIKKLERANWRTSLLFIGITALSFI